MQRISLTPKQLAEGTLAEKFRQERLFASTIVEESLLLLLLEEKLKRERLEQRFHHERNLVALSLATSLRRAAYPVEHQPCMGSKLSAKRFNGTEPLPFDAVDQLSEEEVERIWQREKAELKRRILSVNDRVQKLRE